MSAEIVIEAATESDLPAILALYAQPEIDDGQQLSPPAAKEIFARINTYPNYTVFVAKVKGEIVGTFALLIMDNLGHLGASSGLVEDVAVSPIRQGGGIGTAMMKFAMEKCREAGCYKLALSSSLNRTKAHRFYRALGFEQHGYSFLVVLPV